MTTNKDRMLPIVGTSLGKVIALLGASLSSAIWLICTHGWVLKVILPFEEERHTLSLSIKKVSSFVL